MQERKDELVLRGPILIPFGWIVALFGACGTAISLTFALAVWQTTATTRMDANAASIKDLQSWRKDTDNGNVEMKLKVQRIENMLEFQFPAASRAVPKRDH